VFRIMELERYSRVRDEDGMVVMLVAGFFG
jgi:hypothetical protein